MMTVKEARYLARKCPASKIPTILYFGIVVALFGTMIELPRAEAHVEPKEEIVHQNNYYCTLIRDGHSKVVGAGMDEVRELCAGEGVTL
jgi:hypothetical protein